jgi:hypothetical protein
LSVLVAIRQPGQLDRSLHVVPRYSARFKLEFAFVAKHIRLGFERANGL